MKRIMIFSPATNRFDEYIRDESDPMPIAGPSLSVGEFTGSSNSTLLWSDSRFLNTWRQFREYYGRPIYVGYCFKRIWEGGHGAQSQHYAGASFDTGQNLSSAERDVLYASAISFGWWSYVEPQNLTPTWVHMDARLSPPACSAGYPQQELGSAGVYTLILQDALNALGFSTLGLDGIFGQNTRTALINFQRGNSLPGSGIADCETWRALAKQAHGIGLTPTVLNP